MNKLFKILLLISLSLSFIYSTTHVTQGEILLDQQRSRYVELSVLQAPAQEDEIGDEINLVFRFRMPYPYHINSGSPLIEGLIPTTISITEASLTVIGITYPPSEILDISGFRTTVYYQGPHDILLTLKPDPSLRGVTEITANYSFNYQPCKDDECYAPGELAGTVNLTWEESSLWGSLWNSLRGELPFDLVWVLAFAFLGGLILNVTPCVLPILGLKIISLSTMKQSDRGAKRRFAIFHILGALSFFLLIATGLVILKSSGEQIGWGFQFQNSHYILFITLVLTLVTLNLLGVYEVRFSYQSDYSNKKTHGENLKNFGTGFLSVLLATPCTAPFLGVAVGYSLSQGATTIVLLHTFVAMGFTAPYALIFAGVDVSRLLPRLRPIEQYIKKVLGFVVILTIIWLIDIYGSLNGKQEIFSLLLVIWVISIGVWAYGETQKRFTSAKGDIGFWITVILLGGMIIAWIPTDIETTRNDLSQSAVIQEDSRVDNGLGDSQNSDSIWGAFNKKKLDTLLSDSRPVYVHFTADWCLNCKVNEKLVLETEEVVSLFADYEVVMLKADWTRSDDEIFQEIQDLGRAGIPLDVLYYNDKEIILNSILTVGEIKAALSQIKG